eukprot:366435-Chlamydomonas_euryale.AAC.4
MESPAVASSAAAVIDAPAEAAGRPDDVRTCPFVWPAPLKFPAPGAQGLAPAGCGSHAAVMLSDALVDARVSLTAVRMLGCMGTF